MTIYKLDPNNLSPEVRKIMKTLLAQENAKKSIKAQKKKHGKGYSAEMSRRRKVGVENRKLKTYLKNEGLSILSEALDKAQEKALKAKKTLQNKGKMLGDKMDLTRCK